MIEQGGWQIRGAGAWSDVYRLASLDAHRAVEDEFAEPAEQHGVSSAEAQADTSHGDTSPPVGATRHASPDPLMGGAATSVRHRAYTRTTVRRTSPPANKLTSWWTSHFRDVAFGNNNSVLQVPSTLESHQFWNLSVNPLFRVRHRSTQGCSLSSGVSLPPAWVGEAGRIVG